MEIFAHQGRRLAVRRRGERPTHGVRRAVSNPWLLHDPTARRVLARVAGPLLRPHLASFQLTARLRQLVRRRELIVEEISGRMPGHTFWAGGKRKVDMALIDALEAETHWIEIELVDPLGNPVPSERYLVRAPGGIVRSGSLNENGWARVDGLPPGPCEVTFPYWDEKSWRTAC